MQLRSIVRSLSLALAAAALTACGDDALPATGVDAASVDAVPADAAWGEATVHAHDGASGIAGLRVLFLDPRDGVLLETTTDAAGEATARVEPGSQVLVVSSDGNNVTMWQGVDGGTLDLFVDTYDTKTVIAPTHTQSDGLYEVQTPCGGGTSSTPTVSLPFFRRGCTTGDVVVMWKHGTGGPVALFAADQQLAAGGALDLSARVFAPMASRTATFTSLPVSNQTTFRVDLWLDGFQIGGASNSIFETGGTASLTVAFPDVASAETLFTVSQRRGDVNHVVVRRGAFAETSFDASGHWLPDLSLPTWDAATRTVAWSEMGAGVAATAVQGFAGFDLPGEPATGTDVTWSFVAPPATTLRIPVLPASFADVDPAGATTSYAPSVTAVALTEALASYRARAFGRTGWLLAGVAGVAASVTNRGGV